MSLLTQAFRPGFLFAAARPHARPRVRPDPGAAAPLNRRAGLTIDAPIAAARAGALRQDGYGNSLSRIARPRGEAEIPAHEGRRSPTTREREPRNGSRIRPEQGSLKQKSLTNAKQPLTLTRANHPGRRPHRTWYGHTTHTYHPGRRPHRTKDGHDIMMLVGRAKRGQPHLRVRVAASEPELALGAGTGIW